jgi:hypothetical protein
MSIGTPEILPPEQPTLYCTECGSDVYPTALLCATCGRNRHEPGATSSERLDAPATSKNFKPDFIIGEYLFAVLLGVVFVIMWIASEMHKFHGRDFGGLEFVLMALIGAANLAFWLHVYFNSK